MEQFHRRPEQPVFRVSMSDAISQGLVELINCARGTSFTREEFLAGCRSRARQEEIFEQAYMCNPQGAAINHIVDWSAIERCRYDYEIIRLHLEHSQIMEKFGELSPGNESNREQDIAADYFALQKVTRAPAGFSARAATLRTLPATAISPGLEHSPAMPICHEDPPSVPASHDCDWSNGRTLHPYKSNPGPAARSAYGMALGESIRKAEFAKLAGWGKVIRVLSAVGRWTGIFVPAGPESTPADRKQMKLPSIILASNSPRRAELLRQSGVEFRVVPSDALELHHDQMTARELSQVNAYRKARAVAKRFPDNLVLGADTVVSLDSSLFGKPATLEQAYEMLEKLQGRTHQVVTGLCLLHLRSHRQKVFAESTAVTFHTLDAVKIRRYLTRVNPLDKAGAYAIQENGDQIVERISGSHSNVVGLPMERLSEELRVWAGAAGLWAATPAFTSAGLSTLPLPPRTQSPPLL